eukprot:TRINITY_DN107320_c0_g1_i1.p1 TRINITY_DN107320_c0_g1~~TRINITY_DN107320_c0_g1_i1.p1  ORF type:complete len:121 (-),score=0.92 TRINITY_DN107320_c0_g1_i1:71-433(-)
MWYFYVRQNTKNLFRSYIYYGIGQFNEISAQILNLQNNNWKTFRNLEFFQMPCIYFFPADVGQTCEVNLCGTSLRVNLYGRRYIFVRKSKDRCIKKLTEGWFFFGNCRNIHRYLYFQNQL